MTTSAVVVAKTSGLAKSGSQVRDLATRLERARQARNEKITRADADYVDAVRRALAAVETESVDVRPDDQPVTP